MDTDMYAPRRNVLNNIHPISGKSICIFFIVSDQNSIYQIVTHTKYLYIFLN